jgi:uncharacterized protein DUF1569
MQNLFDAKDSADIVQRLSKLQPSSARQWGKMHVSQMLAHCATAMEVPCGDKVEKQRLIGRVFAPFAKKSVLGEKPMSRNGPTSPDLRIAGDRNFSTEHARLVALVERFCNRGPSAVDGVVHGFFGRLNSDEWGRLMYKHLDHHLRQFSA